jgi:RimJ/RimL family protein N-acetyltransferase
MIVIRKYGLELQSLQSKDLEMVRQWRNSENVRKYFEFQKIISEKEQIEWYASLDLKTNVYCIIHHEGIACGVVSLKEIDWQTGLAEAGVFMGSEIYVKAYIPVVAVIILMEMAFDILDLKLLRAKIHEENTDAIKFNRALGYQKFSKHQFSRFENFRVDAHQFHLCAQSFKKTLQKRYGDHVNVIFEEKDIAGFPTEARERFSKARDRWS